MAMLTAVPRLCRRVTLVDPFDMGATPTRTTPTPAPRPIAAAPTAAPRPVAARPVTGTRPVDPFANVYSDPTQRRPVARPRVQAPPSAHSGAIITEF
jgi:hypothetical protein